MKIFDDLSPKDLRYLIAVVKEENLARAAEVLGVTQTTLSHAIKRIESSVGYDLFSRSARGMRPTEGSRKLATAAESLLLQWELLPRTLRSNSKIEGLYSFGCHETVGLSSLPGFLSGLLSEYALLQLTLFTDVSRNIQASVTNGNLDFGIVVNPLPTDELVIRPIGDDHFGIWVDHSLLKSAQKFRKIDLLYYDPRLFQSLRLIESLSQLQIEPRKFVKVTNLELVAGLASNGAAALLPARVAARYERLVQPKGLPGGLNCLDQFALVYRQENLKSESFKNFARILESKLKEVLKP